MHLHIKLMVAVGVIATLLGSAAKAGEKLDGKQLYRENCKVCHEKGSKNGEYTPMTLVQAQWEKFFKAAQRPAPGPQGQELDRADPGRTLL